MLTDFYCKFEGMKQVAAVYDTQPFYADIKVHDHPPSPLRLSTHSDTREHHFMIQIADIHSILR